MSRLLLLSLLVIALVVTACVGDTAASPTSVAPVAQPTTAPASPTQPQSPTAAPEAMPEQAELSGQAQVAGSTTNQPLVEQLAEAFMDLHPNVVIEVQGGGSSVGVTAAGEGTVDLGMASREVKQSEFDKFPALQVYVIAYDGIAIVTHPDLTIDTLSVEQVRKIFAGEITNYVEVGGPDAEIIVVSREEGSGTRAAFEELVMAYSEGGEAKKADIAANALLQQSNGQVRTTVATTPDTIAYVSFGFLDDSTNPVKIDGVEPAVETVKANEYPIYRPLNVLTHGEPNVLTAAFLEYMLSDAGQQIVAKSYITVN